MCGRFALNIDNDEVEKAYEIPFRINIEKRFNISPGQEILTLLQDDSLKTVFRFITWGFIPHWKKIYQSGSLINARSETVSVKPSFRDAYSGARCIIPASCFYEWSGTSPKQPYIILPEEKIFNFAGIFSRVKNSDNQLINTCCIITREAPPSLQKIHHRAPIIIDRNNISTWLNSRINIQEVNNILFQEEYPKTINYKISTRINNTKNNDKELWNNLSDIKELKDKSKLI